MPKDPERHLSSPTSSPVLASVIEAPALLEGAGLLERRNFGGANSTASTCHATHFGSEALREASVSDRP